MCGIFFPKKILVKKKDVLEHATTWIIRKVVTDSEKSHTPKKYPDFIPLTNKLIYNV